ncbi:MAG: hypothetical protein ACK5JL_07995 [Candidatus Kapaibacterium sp.]
MDPLWEEMPGSSPFHYCFNNPLMMRDPFGLEPDAFKNQLTDVEWHNSGVEKEEASPLKAGSEYSESAKKETIRTNKIAWNLQMRDRDAADQAGAGVSLLFNGSTLSLMGNGNTMFSAPAVSGRPLADGSFDYSIEPQKIGVTGRIPAVKYYINPNAKQW